MVLCEVFSSREEQRVGLPITWEQHRLDHDREIPTVFYGQSHCVGGTGAKPDGHIPTSKGNASLVWGIVPCTRGNEDAERSCGKGDVRACNSLPCETNGQNPSSALVLSSRNNQKSSGISKNQQESAGIGASLCCWGCDPDFRMRNREQSPATTLAPSASFSVQEPSQNWPGVLPPRWHI